MVNKHKNDGLLTKLAVGIFNMPRTLAVVWIAIMVVGVLSYSTFLKREGFPSVNMPMVVVSGTYIINDPARVDAEIAKPISKLAMEQDNISSVKAQSMANFTSIVIQYKQGVDGNEAKKELEKKVSTRANLPETAETKYSIPYFGPTGGSAEKIDTAISFYSTEKISLEELVDRGNVAVKYLNDNKPSLVSKFYLQSPFETAQNPLTGQSQSVQHTFDRLGLRQDGKTSINNSVIIGVEAVEGADVIKLNDQINVLLVSLNSQPDLKGSRAVVSASFAPSIKSSISELQRVLIEGLLAVLVVGSIAITLRASLITVISMITVIATTLTVLYLIGYSLNVITLFALILGLSLVVDDTIIMTEAIESAKNKTKSPRQAVRMATTKISRAMVAATLTAGASFLPLIFVGGVIGSFIRAVPVTIIISLAVSLVVALVFIPMFSRVLLFNKKSKNRTHLSTEIESKIAYWLTTPLRWARGSSKRLFTIGIIAVTMGLLSVGLAGYVFSKLVFNIFPPSKDSNSISINLIMPPGTSLEQSESITVQASEITKEVVGNEFVLSSNYGTSTAQSSTTTIELTPYDKRDITAKEISLRLQQELDKQLPTVVSSVSQIDVGPPASDFIVHVNSNNDEAANRLIDDISSYMQTATLTRGDGSTAGFKDVTVSSDSVIIRNDGKRVRQVSARFTADDTTTLMSLSEQAINRKFNEQKLTSYGLNKDAIEIDMGQESDNQKSFSGLLIAFPVVLVLIFLLLVAEFRSLLQPLLIFLAIPFSLLGVALGLYLTKNTLSFFSVMGFFALIGLTIKNTILLVDYANQSKRSGLGPIESITASLQERFRPLIATSLTAVVSLIPLAITSPFWQGLAVVLIGGLISSTFLVLTVFPYYYLASEFTRRYISALDVAKWVVSSAVVYFVLKSVFQESVIIIVIIYIVLYPVVSVLLSRRLGRQKS